MTLSEFKAWFEGFTENIDGTPSKKQWERIQARVAEIDGKLVTREVIRDRYVIPSRPYWDYLPVTCNTTGPATTAKSLDAVGLPLSMNDIGKIEFEQMRQ